MDRSDLAFVQVALEARIRRLEPALDVLAAEEQTRLLMCAGRLRELASGYAPINHAADELERIAEVGAGVLRLAPHEYLGLAIETIAKLHREPPSNRSSRRADASIEDRRQRRIKRSERLQDMARHHAKRTTIQ